MTIANDMRYVVCTYPSFKEVSGIVTVNRAFRGFAPTIGLSVISSKKRPLNIIEGFYVIKPDNLWPARQSNNRRFLEADNETRNGLKRNMTLQRFSPAR